MVRVKTKEKKARKHMKALTLALLLSLPVPRVLQQQVPQQPVRQLSTAVAKRAKGGKWYFAETGHAVYCYGPVMIVPNANGDLQRVATICRDGSAVVPLRD
jgi:hypothetical protein